MLALQEKAAKRAEITLDTILNDIEDDQERARKLGQIATAMQGNALKAKLTGHDINRHEIGAPGEFDNMRSDEIAAKLLEMLEEAGIIGPTIDVTPSDVTE